MTITLKEIIDSYFDGHSKLTRDHKDIDGDHLASLFRTIRNDLLFLNGVNAIAKEPTGFPNRTDSNISFDDVSRIFTISPVGSSFDYWIGGTQYIKESAETIEISNDEGVHYIYYDGETLSEITSFSTSLFTEHAVISAIYWDVSAGNQIYFSSERHGIIMDGETHLWLHLNQGTQWLTGLALGNFTIEVGAPTGNAAAQMSCENGSAADEDLLISVNDGSPQDLSPILIAPIYYRSGTGDWNRDDPGSFVVKSFVGGSGRAAWNELVGSIWQQSEAPSNDFVLSHPFVTNDINNPVVIIQGQEVYGNIPAAREGATVEINKLIKFGLPFEEFAPLGSIIFQTNTTWTNNAVKSKVVESDTDENYVDFRQFKLSSTGSVVSHANLADLFKDNHFHYALLAGRVGDRQIYPDDAITAILNITPRSSPPSSGNVNDIYLDDGSNTSSGNRGFRICISTGPDVWNDIPG
jgi:hypothetical protein